MSRTKKKYKPGALHRLQAAAVAAGKPAVALLPQRETRKQRKAKQRQQQMQKQQKNNPGGNNRKDYEEDMANFHEGNDEYKNEDSETESTKPTRKDTEVTVEGNAFKITSMSSNTHISDPIMPMKCTLPFPPTTKVLLVGEGDLSFSLCLHTVHNFTSLTCTVYDSESDLYYKYPQATGAVSTLRSAGHTVLFNVDATKLHSSSTPKAITKHAGRWGAVVFMFPHVGGLTKDVDRHVRANQELLLNFFHSARKVLEPKEGVVTMGTFVGKPYEEWGIRALAKAAGFRVRRSGKFEWGGFPGYGYERTLGNVIAGGKKGKGKKGGLRTGGGEGAECGVGEVRGGWSGEKREARMWIFEVNDGTVLNTPKNKNKRKREGKKVSGGNANESSGDEDDSDIESDTGKKRKVHGWGEQNGG
ncbi:hypothetical protein BDZ91DRAFT_721264 [Kalaharituber pfeilii]|nr:hypothetical protein BDZ91DRAFT_721264 [Kalaharituber pfeilii]